MTNAEWSNVWQVLYELWAPQSQRLTGEQQASFRRLIDHLPADEAVDLLRELADSGCKFITASAIRGAVAKRKSRAGEPSFVDLDAVRALREQTSASWAKVDAVIDQHSDVELEAHRRMVLAGNPKLAHALAWGVRAKAWKPFLYRRIVTGVTPDEPTQARYIAGSDLDEAPWEPVTDEELAEADRLLASAYAGYARSACVLETSPLYPTERPVSAKRY